MLGAIDCIYPSNLIDITLITKYQIFVCGDDEFEKSAVCRRKELLRAIDLRLPALKRELAAALSRVFGAICSCKEITYLVEFCEYFGATDLKFNSEFLCKILELSQKGEAAVLLNDDKSSTAI
uniref:Uncharacterized protein n=1 Tax=Salix viminalis TaxID=40686 RepID=A0A6N2KUH4_SALVM